MPHYCNADYAKKKYWVLYLDHLTYSSQHPYYIHLIYKEVSHRTDEQLSQSHSQ